MQNPEASEKEALTADIVRLSGGAIERVAAETVSIRQGGARTITADTVTMQQGGAGLVNGAEVDMHQSGALAIRTQQATLEYSGAAGIAADHLQATHARIGVAVSDRADLRQTSTVVLLARQTEGQVTTLLDTRGTLLAGLVAGLALGLTLIAGSLLARRR